MSNHNKETEARCFHCYRHYVEGTAAWALYMMRMGHKVTNPKYDPRIYYLPEGGMIQIDEMEIIAGNQWIDYWCIDIPDGWEIYEEPKPEHPAINDYNRYDYIPVEGIRQPKPEPQPLLADAQVGWLCKLRNGEWRQIKGFGDSWGTNDCPNPNLFTVFLTDGTTRNIYGTYLGTTANPLPNDIIATEPLAPEGTAEWAWQMLKLGKPVTNKRVFIGGYIKATCSDKYHFVQTWGYSGWQLYELKPEPQPAYAVRDWVEFNPGNNPHQVRIVKVDGEKLHYIDEKGYQTHIYISAITRKLKPYDVVVDIGCLKGTVAQCGDKEEEVFALRTKNNAAIIPVAVKLNPKNKEKNNERNNAHLPTMWISNGCLRLLAYLWIFLVSP
jgi:hypothetical protein